MSVSANQTKEEMLSQAKAFFDSAYRLQKDGKNKDALANLQEANKIYIAHHDMENISICLSWISFLNYQLSPANYYKILIMLNDAKFLAENSNSPKALFNYYFASGSMNYLDKNYMEALYHLDKAKNLAEKDSELNSRIYIQLAKIYEKNEQFEKAYVHWELALKTANLNETESCVVEDSIKRLKKYRDDMKFKTPFNDIQEAIPVASEKDPLVALLKIARTVSAQTNIDVLLKTIAEITKNALEADRCTVFLLDKEKNEIWSKVALGLESEEIRFPADKGLAGHVASTGETIIINDAYNDARFNKEIDLQTGYKTKTILCMPVRNIKHEIVGVFQVLNKNAGYFNEHDEDLLVAIGSSAGIALENARLFKHQQEIFDQQKYLFSSFIDTLSASIDARDKITSGHSSRVKLYSKLICDELNLDSKLIEAIEHAAILHDIGKIGIRDSVLQKEGKLTDDEYSHIQGHVQITHDILSKIYLSNNSKDVAEIASSHHEKYDGTGYFRALSGENIHLGGRILAVSDVFDAITSKRHYRDKMPVKDAVEILLNGSGTHFDSTLINAFLNISLDKIVNIFLTEFNTELNGDDENILNKHTMLDLYTSISQDTDLLEDSKKNLIDIFNKYYTNKSTLN